MTDLCSLSPPAGYRPTGILSARATNFDHIPPGFLPLPVRNTAGDRIRPIGLVLHVQAGNGSPFGWFNNSSSQASSTLWAGKDGGREQYTDLDVRAWAQGAGNETYASIETEGQPGEPLTDLQVDSVAVAMAFGAREFGWPLQLANQPGQPGLGTHAMGGAAWGGHSGCPGVTRAGERAEILRRARDILHPPEDPMPTAAEIAAAVWAAGPPGVSPAIRQPDMGDVAGATYNKAGDLQTRMVALAKAFATWVPAGHPAAAILAAAAADAPADEAPLTALVSALTDAGELAEILRVAATRLALVLTPAAGS